MILPPPLIPVRIISEVYERMMSKRVGLTCLVIAIVGCLCLSVLFISGTVGILLQRGPLSFLPSFKPPAASATPAATLTADEINQKMDQIQSQVTAIRGLQPKSDLKRALLTPDELRQHVTDEFLKDYTQTDARDEALTAAAFGLLQPDFDLYDFYDKLYAEQIAGYYDDQTKEMYVVKGEDFLGTERMTYAHEYDHALQDQNYDIQNGLGFSEENCKKETERCAAVQALLEGDATVVEFQWFSQDATAEERKQIMSFAATYSGPVFDSAPDYIKQSFLFPYQQGQEFVQYIYDHGGWAAVDQAFQNPPQSTEQILHPEKYPADAPLSVQLPDLTQTLGEGWQEIDRGTQGEWGLYLVLAHGLDPTSDLSTRQAQTATAGWGGDAYAVYYNDSTNETAMVTSTTWDTAQDAKEFVDAFTRYATNRFGKPSSNQSGSVAWQNATSYTLFEHSGSSVIWVLAPDQATALKLLAAIHG